MTLNQIKKAAEIAKSRTSDKRWLAAIDKAVAGFENWIVTELHDHILVTTDSGETYHANGACQCKAYTHGGKSACKHRALYRLIQIARETEAAEEAARRCDRIIEDIKTIASSREEIIADIRARWPHNEINLADELMARFRRNTLESLATDFLIAIQAVI